MLHNAPPTVTKTGADFMVGVPWAGDGATDALRGERSRPQAETLITLLDDLADELAQIVFRVDQHLSQVTVMSAVGRTHLEQATRLVNRTVGALLSDPCCSQAIAWLAQTPQSARRNGISAQAAVVLLAGLFAGREGGIIHPLTCGLSGDTLAETETIHHRVLQELASGETEGSTLPALIKQLAAASEMLQAHLGGLIREDEGWPRARRLVKEINRGLAGLALRCRGEVAARTGSFPAGEGMLLELLGRSVVGLAGRQVSVLSSSLRNGTATATFHPGLAREQQALSQLLRRLEQGKIEPLEMAEKVETLQRWAYLAQQTGLPDDEALRIEVESLSQLAVVYGGLAGYLRANLPRLLRILYRKVTFEPAQREQMAALYRYLGGVWVDIKRTWSV